MPFKNKGVPLICVVIGFLFIFPTPFTPPIDYRWIAYCLFGLAFVLTLRRWK